MGKSLFQFLAIGLLINLAACSTPSLRSPALVKNDIIYQYSNHFSCVVEKVSSDDSEKIKWSALSGFKIGTKSFFNWQSLNKRALRPFTSDGCSMSPNGVPAHEENRKWSQCCVEHDIAYWTGGTRSDKEAADQELQKCIAQKGYPEIAKVYKLFVEEFGGPDSSLTFRWGYGWNYRRPFSPLSAQEEAMFADEYGVRIERARQNLKESFVNLVKLCDTYDYGLQNLSLDEEKIFHALSNRVKKDDVIEWAKQSYFNFEKREYLLKLQSCQNPITFIFFENKEKSPEVVTDCPNL